MNAVPGCGWGGHDAGKRAGRGDDGGGRPGGREAEEPVRGGRLAPVIGDFKLASHVLTPLK